MRTPTTRRATNLRTLATRTADALAIPVRATKAIVEQFLFEVEGELCAGNDVYLRNFGRFAIKDQAVDLEFYRARGVALPAAGDVRLRICRFALVRTLRRQVNGLVVVTHEPDQESRQWLQAQTQSGISLADIVDRLNSEVRDARPV